MNVTAPTQEPIFAQDINLAVNTLSTLNKYEQLLFMYNILSITLFYSATETFIANLMINDTFFEVSMFNYN